MRAKIPDCGLAEGDVGFFGGKEGERTPRMQEAFLFFAELALAVGLLGGLGLIGLR
jgi:hypothetical protein